MESKEILFVFLKIQIYIDKVGYIFFSLVPILSAARYSIFVLTNKEHIPFFRKQRRQTS